MDQSSEIEAKQASPLKIVNGFVELKENGQDGGGETSENLANSQENPEKPTSQENSDAVISQVRKPPLVKNTFVGGVRYFAPTEDVIPLSDEDEVSPFEPNRPRFQGSRSSAKCALQDDTGERPFLIFGDIEDKVSELQLDPEPNDIRAAIELKNRREKIYFKKSGIAKAVEPDFVFDGVSPPPLEVIDLPGASGDYAAGGDAPSLTPSTTAPSARKKPSARNFDRLTAKGALMPRAKQSATAILAAKGRQAPTPAMFNVEPMSIMRPERNHDLDPIVFKELTPDEQLKADANSLIASVLAKGTRVLGKWLDRNLYPGVVLRNDILGGYKVRFADGESREMPSTDVVPLFRLKEGDQLMLSVTSRRGEYEFHPSVITKCPDKKNAVLWTDGVFEVENKTKLITEKIPWEKLAIESRQLKNYVTQKRTLTSLSQIFSSATAEASGAARRSLRPKRPKLLTDDYDTSATVDDSLDVYDFDEDSNDDDADYTQGDGPFAGADEGAYGAPPRTSWARTPRGGGRGRGAAKRGRWMPPSATRTALFIEDDEVIVDQQAAFRKNKPRGGRSVLPKIRPMNPPPQVFRNKPPPALAPEGALVPNRGQKMANKDETGKTLQSIDRTLFSDMKFLLTSATRVKEPANLGGKSTSTMPFIKRQVRQMIDERGGIVVEDFSQLSGNMTDTYLIADQFYRTHKYLSALVRAVPCVSHAWISECCKENQLLHPTIFMLPAGRTLETDAIVKWHNKCPSLLSGLFVYMHTENKPENSNTLNFVQIWTPIAKMMGASIVEKLPDSGHDPASTKIDILLTDSSCPQWVVDRCTSYGAHAVSSEWLIQGIIVGHLPQTDGHPKYRHDFEQATTPSAQAPLQQYRQRAPQSDDPMSTAVVLDVDRSPVVTSPKGTAVSTIMHQLQQCTTAMESTEFLDSASLTDAIDITNMTAEQLQALGIQFVEATDLDAVLASGQQQQIRPQAFEQAVDPQEQHLDQLLQFDQQPQALDQQQFVEGADPTVDADNVIMISPEDLELLNQEGVQIISQNGVIIIQQADGTQTIVNQSGASAGGAQIQMVESSTGDGAATA